jgi:hypothetical protein
MATKSKKSTSKKATNGKSAPPRKESKTAKVIAMLRRAGGVTREQVLEVTGWKAVSLQSVATKVGLKLKVDESKRPFTYRA